MKLTKKELEIMAVLWGSQTPMTTAEIIETSVNPTWKENSIWGIMNVLAEKGAVVLANSKPTGTNYARAYKPALTVEEYTIASISDIQKVGKTGLQIDFDVLIDGINKMREG